MTLLLDDLQARLDAEYRSRAEGKPWYEGTGNDDAILPFQWEGVRFGAAAGRYILGDDMGLGKTRQSIGWLDLVQARRVLVVCQADICDQFAGEVMDLAPHREVVNLYKKTPATRHALMDAAMGTDAVIVVNFEIWRKDKVLLEKMLRHQFDTVIVDEAHNLKKTATANFRYIETIVKAENVCPNCRGPIVGLREKRGAKNLPKPCPSCGWQDGQPTGVRFHWPLDKWLSSKSVKHLCLTTGTPLLNSPIDLFALLHLCDPLLFKTQAGFKRAYLTQNHHTNKLEFRTGQLENLRPLMAGRFIARTKTDAGIVLPEQRRHIVRVDLEADQYPGQHKVVHQLSKAAVIRLESGEQMNVMDVMALITRKRQANVWPAGITQKDVDGNVIFSVGDEVQESCKLDAVLDSVVRLHQEGRRQVVFSQFKTALAELERRFVVAGLRVARLDGDTPSRDREAIKLDFYRGRVDQPQYDLLLAHYRTGGTGLNLTAATVTHILDEEWNAGKRDQAYARTNRLGQTEVNDVYVYRVPASIDTWMSNVIHRKEKLVAEFTGTMRGEGVLELQDELKDLMKSGELA